MYKLYSDSGELTWDGQFIKGNKNIQSFLNNLLTLDHEIKTLHAQPLLKPHARKKVIVMIQVSGRVRSKDQDERPKLFLQDLFITLEENQWKIISDCFRLVK